MAKKFKEIEKKTEPVVVAEPDNGLVTVEALRDYTGSALWIKKGETRLIPFAVAQKILADHVGCEPIRVVRSFSAPFNKAITEESVK